MRKGSDLMRLMPNSMISVKAKKKNGSSPGRKAVSSGAQDAEGLTRDASLAPAPLTIQVLQSDHSKVKQ